MGQLQAFLQEGIMDCTLDLTLGRSEMSCHQGAVTSEAMKAWMWRCCGMGKGRDGGCRRALPKSFEQKRCGEKGVVSEGTHGREGTAVDKRPERFRT